MCVAERRMCGYVPDSAVRVSPFRWAGRKAPGSMRIQKRTSETDVGKPIGLIWKRRKEVERRSDVADEVVSGGLVIRVQKGRKKHIQRRKRKKDQARNSDSIALV